MIRSLIEEFKLQHHAILVSLGDAYRAGVVTPAGREALLEGKKLLLAHLRKEDEEFYPRMRKAALKDQQLTALLDVFGNDLEAVTAPVLRFFDKLDRDSAPLAGEYVFELGNLAARLKGRIANEEAVLYPEYERLGL